MREQRTPAAPVTEQQRAILDLLPGTPYWVAQRLWGDNPGRGLGSGSVLRSLKRLAEKGLAEKVEGTGRWRRVDEEAR